MGAPKTKTVGGGQATNTANSWNQFLNQGLSSGTFGGAASNNGLAGAINQGLAGTGAQMGLPSAPAMQGFNPTGLPTNLDLSGFNYTPNLPGMDNAWIQGMMNQSGNLIGGGAGGGAVGGMAGTQATGVPDFFANQMKLNPVDMNDPQYAAMAQMLQQNNALGLANARARFGQGGNALSSGASLAEAQYNAQVNPASILALGELNRSMRGMNLQEAGALEQAYQGRLGLGSQSQLGNRGISSQESIANAGNITQASIANANNALQGMGYGLQGQGQLLNYLINSGQLGLGAAGQNAQNAMGAFNANMQAGQYNNQNAYNAANMANNFNLGLFGQQSQNAATQAGFNQQAQQNAMNNMFGAFGQANQLGTPAAQTVQVQPWWSQALGAAGQVAGIAGQFMNPFRGMSPSMSTGMGGSPLSQMAPNIYGSLNPANSGGFNPSGYNPMGGGLMQGGYPNMGVGGYNPMSSGLTQFGYPNMGVGFNPSMINPRINMGTP